MILIFLSGKKRERNGPSKTGREDEERRTEDRGRHWCRLSITSLPGLTNESPSQRFICSSLLFLYCISKAGHNCRRTTGNDESIGGVTIVVCYMNICRLAYACACEYVSIGIESCERVTEDSFDQQT